MSVSAFTWNSHSVYTVKTHWPHQISDRQLKCNGSALHWGFNTTWIKCLAGSHGERKSECSLYGNVGNRWMYMGEKANNWTHIGGWRFPFSLNETWCRPLCEYNCHWSSPRLRQIDHQCVSLTTGLSASCIVISPQSAIQCLLLQLAISSLFHKVIH